MARRGAASGARGDRCARRALAARTVEVRDCVVREVDRDWRGDELGEQLEQSLGVVVEAGAAGAVDACRGGMPDARQRRTPRRQDKLRRGRLRAGVADVGRVQLDGEP
jgi:hypothetical protein